MPKRTHADRTGLQAMGHGTTAGGDYSTAAGHSTHASGSTSVAFGINTIASGTLLFPL
jgi:hypothetical protein